MFLFLHTGGVDRLADGKGFLQLKATPHIIPLMACGAQRADDFDGRQSLTLYSVLNRLSLSLSLSLLAVCLRLYSSRPTHSVVCKRLMLFITNHKSRRLPLYSRLVFFELDYV